MQTFVATPTAVERRWHVIDADGVVLGRVATEAGVGTLVLSHFVPGGPVVADATWLDAVRPHFDGRIVIAHDLMTLP